MLMRLLQNCASLPSQCDVWPTSWAATPQALYLGTSKKAMKHANPPPKPPRDVGNWRQCFGTFCLRVADSWSGTAPRLYRLTPKSAYEGATKVTWQLVVEPPSAQASIDSPRIGLMLSPLRFDYYAQANWVDRAPLMVQSLMVESFDNSQAIIAVGRESIGLRPDYVLKSELREFQAEQTADLHRVNVALKVKLVQMPERQIVASAEFEHQVQAPRPL